MTLYVVTGPPCAGKSTWVRERAQTGDIVVDLDRLALAITAEHTPHHEYPAHIRRAAIQVRKTAVAIALAYSRTGTSYVIHAKPTERIAHVCQTQSTSHRSKRAMARVDRARQSRKAAAYLADIGDMVG